MSPTFLELIVAILLVYVAWRIGVWLAPHIFGPGRSSRRETSSSKRSANWPLEKNITPPTDPAGTPKKSCGDLPK